MEHSLIDSHLAPVNKKKLLLKQSVTEYDLSRAVIVYSPHQRPLHARNLASPLRKSETFASFRETIPEPAPEFTPGCTDDHSDDEPSCDPLPCSRNLEDSKTTTVSYTYIFMILSIGAVILCTWDFKSMEMLSCDESFKLAEPDVSAVHSELKKALFGQPAATVMLVDSLKDLKLTVNQMAILMLMGGTGTGKTWTTQLISRSLPKTVNQLNIHLELWSKNEDVNDTLSKLKPCAWNFVFVEDSDRAERYQIEAFVSILSRFRQDSQSSRQKLVVIINSSTGQEVLAQLLHKELQSGASRLDLAPVTLQQSLQQVSSLLIEVLSDNKLDYVAVPYLPLEKTHLRQCILQDLQLKNKQASEVIVNNVIEHFRFYPKGLEYFSATGCKSVSSHVNLYV